MLIGWAPGYFTGYLAADFIDSDKARLRLSPNLASDYAGVELVLNF